MTSFGIGCGIPGIPGVYTRVSAFYEWIWDNEDIPTTPIPTTTILTTPGTVTTTVITTVRTTVTTTKPPTTPWPTTTKSTEPPTDCSTCYADILRAVADCMNAGDIGW